MLADFYTTGTIKDSDTPQVNDAGKYEWTADKGWGKMLFFCCELGETFSDAEFDVTVSARLGPRTGSRSCQRPTPTNQQQYKRTWIPTRTLVCARSCLQSSAVAAVTERTFLDNVGTCVVSRSVKNTVSCVQQPNSSTVCPLVVMHGNEIKKAWSVASQKRQSWSV